MAWTNLFARHILQRGWAYNIEGRVSELHDEDGMVSAVVMGSEDYAVTLELWHDEPKYFTCSCPHAQEGNYCKHMAATAFAWQDSQTSNTNFLPKDPSERAAQLVEQATLEALRLFALEAIAAHPGLVVTLFDQIKQQPNKLTLPDYLMKADRLLAGLGDGHYPDNDDYDDYDRYEVYEDSYDYFAYEYDDYKTYPQTAVTALEEMLCQDIVQLIDRGQTEDAFELIRYIWPDIVRRSGDQYDFASKLEAPVMVAWESLYDKADQQLKEALFNWLVTRAGENDTIAAGFLFSTFEEGSYLERKLKLVQEKLVYHEFSDDYWVEFRLSFWVIQLARVMQQLNYPPNEIAQRLAEFKDYPRIRFHLVDFYLSLGEKDQAICLLREGFANPENNRHAAREFKRRLIELYRDDGDEALYRAELGSYVRHWAMGNMTVWDEYKQLFSPKEWLQERRAILDSWPKQVDRNDILVAEEMYPELLQSVVNGSYDSYYKYSKILKPLYPDELLDYLKQFAIRQVEEVSGRSVYRQAVAILRQMQTYPGGRAVVTSLVNQWRIEYKRRRAMMDELNRL